MSANRTVTQLSQQDDVNIVSPTNNQGLVWDSTLGKWKNDTVTTDLSGCVKLTSTTTQTITGCTKIKTSDNYWNVGLCDMTVGAGDFYDDSGNDTTLATGLYSILAYGNVYITGQSGNYLSNGYDTATVNLITDGGQSFLACYYDIGGTGITETPCFEIWGDGTLSCNAITSYGDMTISGTINAGMSQTTVNGSSGRFKWVMPFAGYSYKKVVIYFAAYVHSSGSKTVTFPTAFTYAPAISSNTTGITPTISATTIVIPSVSSAATGWIILEGF